MQTYSFTKGLQKAVVGAAVAGLAISGAVLYAAFPDLANLSIADLLASQAHMIFGTVTIGGAITLVVNYIKVRFGN